MIRPEHGRTLEAGARNIESLRTRADFAALLGVRVMLENVPGRFNSVAQLAPIFDARPTLGLHLDIGHSNLDAPHNYATELIARFASRLAHVHDNRGGHANLHLALGMGDIDFAACLGTLRGSGYGGTITLEVFSRDRHSLAHSRDRLRELWAAAA
ncbi:MAG TPA: TIM barrel protein [Opitutaceae bacterium]|nr:TIM barrel protein [Opitutaceae bacterium]